MEQSKVFIVVNLCRSPKTKNKEIKRSNKHKNINIDRIYLSITLTSQTRLLQLRKYKRNNETLYHHKVQL